MSCCEPHSGYGGGCCCCGGSSFPRRYYTRQGRLGHPEKYYDNLKAELAAVERKLACMKEQAAGD